MKKLTSIGLLIFAMMMIINCTAFAFKFQLPITQERKNEIDNLIAKYAEEWKSDPDFEISNGKTKNGNKHELIIPFIQFPDHCRDLDVTQMRNFNDYIGRALEIENPHYYVVSGKANFHVIYEEETGYTIAGGNNGDKEITKYYKEMSKKFKSKDLIPYYYSEAISTQAFILTDGKTSYVKPLTWTYEDGTRVSGDETPILTGDEWLVGIKEKWENAYETTEEEQRTGSIPAGGGPIVLKDYVYPPQHDDSYIYYIVSAVSLVLICGAGFIIYKRKKKIKTQ